MSGPRWRATSAVVWASVAVAGVLASIELGALPAELAQRTGDTLQLVLAAAAAGACLRAAARGPAAARTFWLALGLGCLSWAGGQVFWVVRVAPFSTANTYAESDVLFAASTAMFLVAYVLRPDRGHDRMLPVALAVALLAIAMLYLFCEIALVHLLAGDTAAYEVWSRLLFDFRGLALLPAVWWALRHSEPPWTELYRRLAPAFVLLQLGSVITNQSFTSGIAGPYHAGLYDLPWTLPFVWIALVASRWQREIGAAASPAPPAAPAMPGWRRTRRASVVALVSLLLFPVVHILVSQGDAPQSPLAHWRAGFALAGTLLAAGLFLARQQVVLREAEQKLREGEARYRALLDTGTDAVGVYGRDLRVQYVSGAISAIAGYRPDQRLGHSPLELAHPDDTARVRSLVDAVLAAPGELVRDSFRARDSQGQWHDLEVDAVNRLDEPAVRGIVANFRDVTERRRAERERERSLSLLEATLDATADGILVVDVVGRIERANQKFAAMWRVPGELVAAGDNDRVLAFVLDQLQEPAAFLEGVQALAQQLERESIDTLRFRDGRVFERYVLPQRLAGELVGRVLSFRDVSERTHAEEAMARLVAIIEATPDFVGTCDAELRPLYLNRAGRRMVGLADDATLVGQTPADVHSPRAARRAVEEAFPTAARTGIWSGETLLRHTSGREIPVLQVVLAHREASGEVAFYSTIARDISQRIEAEQELRRSHTMAALGSLVAGVAHEVRNPLFGISSTLDAFEARFGQAADYGEYVRVLRDQLERLSSLMNDLLEYAKPTRLELGPGRLEEVVADALRACAATSGRARVTIETRLAPDLPALRMDARRLGQVFRNLLENAVQHSPAGGHVRLEARLERDPGAAWVVCSVDDDGRGLSPEDLPHVFEPFYTRRHGGTGLGLSIVHRIVTDHGGRISASNREAGGARLSVALPVRPLGGW